MPRYLTFIFHLYAVCQSAFALHVYHYYADVYRPASYGGQWKYLSYINLHLQMVYFSICIIIHGLEQFKIVGLECFLKQLKDYYYAILCFPCCLAVLASFWSVYFFNRELVHPIHLDDVLPQWANHLFHTSILILIVDVCFYHDYPSRLLGLTTCSFFEFLYLIWVLWVKYQSDIWVYSFMAKLNVTSFTILFFIEILFSWFTYLLGEYLNKQINIDTKIKNN